MDPGRSNGASRPELWVLWTGGLHRLSQQCLVGMAEMEVCVEEGQQPVR